MKLSVPRFFTLKRLIGIARALMVMKTLFTFVLMTFSVLVSNSVLAQQSNWEQYLGAARDDIKYTMEGAKIPLKNTGVTSYELAVYDSYQQGENNLVNFYYDEKENCIEIRLIMKPELAPYAVQDFNKKYIKYANNEWMSQDYSFGARIVVDNNLLVLTFKKLSKNQSK